MPPRVLASIVCLLALSSCASAQSLRVAAASDLQFAMNDLANKFQKKSGVTLSISFSSSGNFISQIENGAPFDIFLSADERYPQQLIKDGKADAQSFVIYARGQLVLWSLTSTNLRLADRGFSALSDPRVVKIAVANPEHAPYGRAAVAALRNARLYDLLKSKLVYGDNISQTAQFAQSGNAQVAIIALSLSFAESMKNGDSWQIPTDLYPPIKQAAVVVSASSNKAAANSFLEFLRSEESQTLLSRYGLSPPALEKKD